MYLHVYMLICIYMYIYIYIYIYRCIWYISTGGGEDEGRFGRSALFRCEAPLLWALRGMEVHIQLNLFRWIGQWSDPSSTFDRTGSGGTHPTEPVRNVHHRSITEGGA